MWQCAPAKNSTVLAYRHTLVLPDSSQNLESWLIRGRCCSMALYRLAQAAAKRWPTAVALRSQTEALTLDFATLESRAAATAAVLQSKGLEAGQVLVSDLQNTSQNLVVQLACSSLGVACLSQRPARGHQMPSAAATLGRAYAIDAIHCPQRIPRRWHGQKRRRAREAHEHIRCRRHPLHRRAE